MTTLAQPVASIQSAATMASTGEQVIPALTRSPEARMSEEELVALVETLSREDKEELFNFARRLHARDAATVKGCRQ